MSCFRVLGTARSMRVGMLAPDLGLQNVAHYYVSFSPPSPPPLPSPPIDKVIPGSRGPKTEKVNQKAWNTLEPVGP